MLIRETTPHVRQFAIKQEPTDKNYGECLWMTVTLDLDRYTMSAQSDAGDYSHTWSVTDKETFLHLMCRIDQEYLLRKISSETRFNLAESIKSTWAYLHPSETTRKLRKALNDIDASSEESFYHTCNEILDEFKIPYDFETIQIVKDYPHGAVVFSKIFCDVLQPYMRGLLAKEEAEKEAK